MISEFRFLAFILFFVYNLASGTVSIKCFYVISVVTISGLCCELFYVSMCFNFNVSFSIRTFCF